MRCRYTSSPFEHHKEQQQNKKEEEEASLVHVGDWIRVKMSLIPVVALRVPARFLQSRLACLLSRPPLVSPRRSRLRLHGLRQRIELVGEMEESAFLFYPVIYWHNGPSIAEKPLMRLA